MPDDISADFAGLVSREQAENAFREALNLFVGRGRQYSVEQLAKGCKVPKRKIECFKGYRLGHPDYRPLDFGDIISISKFLRSGFVTEWLQIADMLAVEPADAGHDDLAAACIDYTATHAKARHPDSEHGVEIGPNENRALNLRRARLVA